jgi:hypothetical protein
MQRKIENEAVFRRANEKVHKELNELKKLAQTEDYPYMPELDAPLHFFCECSNENCRKRIIIKPSEYSKIHSNRKIFLVKPTHEDLSIEEIVTRKPDYNIVKKIVRPPERPKKLHKTDIENI